MAPDREDALTAILWELGTTGTQAVGSADGRLTLIAYFFDRPRLEDDLARETAPLAAEVTPTDVPEVDWVARVREGFRAFRVGGFRVVPAWEADEEDRARADTLVVEPGTAFGTGTHESTRLCLGIVLEVAAAGPLGDVLDVGCGSGILAIACARRGARRVVALEIDPEALPVARRHALLNRTTLALVRGDGARPVRGAGFDLVLANISAALLAERAGELAAALRPGGRLVLSGLLDADVPAVGAAFTSVGPIEVRHEGGWAALVVRRAS